MTIRLTKKHRDCHLPIKNANDTKYRQSMKAIFRRYILKMDMIFKETLVLPVQPDIITMEMTSI